MSLSAEQLAMRRTGLTATDMVVLASGSDWHGRTAHDVWRAKVLEDDGFAATEAMRVGSALEPAVIALAAEKLGRSYAVWTSTVRHPEHARYLCTPDADTWLGLDPDSHRYLQTKVVGYHAAREWGEGEGALDLPESVFVQCAWEMFVTRKDVHHVGALLGTEVRTYTIDRARDGVDELVDGLREIGDRFWRDHVETRVPPEVDGSEGAKRMLAALYPKPRSPMAPASPDAEFAARAYFDASRAAKEADEAKRLAQQKLVAEVGERHGLEGDGWRLRYDWRDPVEVAATTRKGYRHFDCRPTKGH